MRSPSSRLTPALAAHLFTLAALAAWAAASSVVPAYIFPSLQSVLLRMVDLLSAPRYLLHGFASVGHVVVALASAFVLGMALALTAHYVPVTRLMIHGRLNPFLNSFSGLGWTFLAVVWFGVSHFTVLFAITAVLLPLAVINLREGLLQLDAEIVEMAASFGRRRVRRFFKITLPLLFPYIVASLRICYGVAWIIALTVELFGGNSGYGYLMNIARTEFDLPIIFAIIAIMIAMVYGTDRLVFVPIQTRMRRHYGSV
jgi:NitT/TauT family transport system permease protein/sulfonate transport system permease protein